MGKAAKKRTSAAAGVSKAERRAAAAEQKLQARAAADEKNERIAAAAAERKQARADDNARKWEAWRESQRQQRATEIQRVVVELTGVLVRGHGDTQSLDRKHHSAPKPDSEFAAIAVQLGIGGTDPDRRRWVKTERNCHKYTAGQQNELDRNPIARALRNSMRTVINSERDPEDWQTMCGKAIELALKKLKNSRKALKYREKKKAAKNNNETDMKK